MTPKFKNKLLIISLILNVLLITLASAYIIKNSKGFRQKYLKKFNKEKLIMFGDSHTNRGDWNELLDRNDVLKFGFGGFSSSQLEYIMKQVVIDRNASYCFIQGGGNDIAQPGFSPGRVKDNLESMIIYLKSNNIKPVLQSLFHRPDPEYNLIIDSLNAELKQLALSNNIDFIDVNKHLDANNSIGDHVMPDNIHLNQKGYEIWGRVIKDYLEEKGI